MRGNSHARCEVGENSKIISKSYLSQPSAYPVYASVIQGWYTLLSSPEIENIFENSDFVYLLNQASGDRKILCDRLNISAQQAAHISNAGPGEGLIFFGNVILPFVDNFPKDNELYEIMTTKLDETTKEKV